MCILKSGTHIQLEADAALLPFAAVLLTTWAHAATSEPPRWVGCTTRARRVGAAHPNRAIHSCIAMMCISTGNCSQSVSAGCSITDSGGIDSTVLVETTLATCSVHIVNSTITDNEHLGGIDHLRYRAAILSVQNTGIWLEGTEVRRNDAPVLMRTRDNDTGVIVTDTQSVYITQIPGSTADCGDMIMRRTAAPLQPPPQYEFMTGAEQWFRSMVQVRIWL